MAKRADGPPNDTTLLRALIGSKKVQGKERTSFQSMWDDLQMGRLVQLSKAQRAWAEKRYTDLDLSREPLPPPPEVKVKQKTVLPWENEGADKKPLKPPGRA